jgi:AraC family transcriptional activator of pobA
VNEDDIIIRDYHEAFRKYAKDGIIDMDNRLKYKFSFQTHRLETAVKEWEGTVPPNRQSQFFIVLVKKGMGEKTIGNFTFPIQKNLLFVIPRRVTHSSRYLSVDCLGYAISFNLEFFLQNVFPKQHIVNKKIFKNSIKPFLILSDKQVSQLGIIFEYILKERNEQQKDKNEMIAIKVLELIVTCDRFFTNAETKQNEHIYNDVVERFNELIEKNFTKERSVQFYADALNMHPNSLNFLIKKYTGLTAKQIIINHILLEAKFLLHSSSLSIKEIAYKLGFDDPNYFSSFFSKKLNLPPLHYKREPV